MGEEPPLGALPRWHDGAARSARGPPSTIPASAARLVGARPFKHLRALDLLEGDRCSLPRYDARHRQALVVERFDGGGLLGWGRTAVARAVTAPATLQASGMLRGTKPPRTTPSPPNPSHSFGQPDGPPAGWPGLAGPHLEGAVADVGPQQQLRRGREHAALHGAGDDGADARHAKDLVNHHLGRLVARLKPRRALGQQAVEEAHLQTRVRGGGAIGSCGDGAQPHSQATTPA
jgi:hypothetical protein